MGLLDNQTQSEYYNGNDLGNYQFVTLENIINAFMFAYVGEGKVLAKVNRTDVQDDSLPFGVQFQEYTSQYPLIFHLIKAYS